MAVNTYLVHLHDNAHDDESARESVAELIHSIGGFILMATNAGSLIAAFDEKFVGRFCTHRAVAFASGVSLNPNGKAGEKLRALFAHNIAAQLAARGIDPSGGAAAAAPAPAPAESLPPGYRPLRWRERFA